MPHTENLLEFLYGISKEAAYVRVLGVAGDADWRFFSDITDTRRRAGHPTYSSPASAISPDANRVCSSSMLPSSIDAPESSREPERRAHLHKGEYQ